MKSYKISITDQWKPYDSGPGYYITGYKIENVNHLQLAINVGGEDKDDIPSTIDPCFSLSNSGKLQYSCKPHVQGNDYSTDKTRYSLGYQQLPATYTNFPSLNLVGLFNNLTVNSSLPVTYLPKVYFDENEELKFENTTLQNMEWVAKEPLQGGFSETESDEDSEGRKVYLLEVFILDVFHRKRGRNWGRLPEILVHCTMK